MDTIIGTAALLLAYSQVCAPEEPLPVDKLVVVAHAARMNGIDVTSDTFKREVDRRIENLKSTVAFAGTRKWCALTAQTLNVYYTRVQDQKMLDQEKRDEEASAKISNSFNDAFNKAHPECADYKTNPNLPSHCY